MVRITKYWLVGAALITLVAAAPLQAAPDLYSAEVAVPNQSEQARDQALQTALGKVIVRISGDADAAISSAGRQVTSRARQMVQQFGYARVPIEPDPDAQTAPEPAAPGADGEPQAPEVELRLRVRFNSGAVNNALREAGLPVWGSERPNTMLWVARADGGRPELVTGEQARPLKQAAADRGVPIELPRQDPAERQRAGAADVVAGYTDRLHAVARGYGASHILVGKIYNDDGLWIGQWTLAQSGQNLDEWRDSDTTEQELLAQAVQRTADVYARRFAVSANGQSDSVTVVVDRVDSAQDYARISRYIAQLTAVKSVIPALVSSDYVVFQVQLAGDAQVLRRSMGLADWLAEDDAAQRLAKPLAASGATMGYRITP